MEPGQESAEGQEGQELSMPEETEMIIGLVADPEARKAVEDYRDASLGYLRWLKANLEAPQEEIEEAKKPVHVALDGLIPHKKKPVVSQAVLAVVYGEMKIQGDMR